MRCNKWAALLLMATISSVTYADTPAFGPDSVLQFLQSAMAPAVNKLTAKAITWLTVFSTLQWFITNYGVLKSEGADLQKVLTKALASIAWLSVCLYIVNHGPEFIGAVGDEMFGVLGMDLPSPGSIIGNTITVVASLTALAVGVGGIGIIGSSVAGMLIVYILLFVLAVGMFFAFKIFMIQLELGLVVMLSPLSFSFLGMDALRDQGIAPFKALISLAYRILLLTVILSAFSEVSSVASSALGDLTSNAFKDGGIGTAMNIVLSALGTYLMLAYLVFKSDSIAASLAGGSTSMSTADMAGAAAAGAAAGAAIAAGGAASSGLMEKASQSMTDFMQGLRDGGSISNAGSSGSGSADTSLLSPPSSSMSMNSEKAPSSSSGTSSFDGSSRGLTPAQSAQIAPSDRHYARADLGNPQPPKIPSAGARSNALSSSGASGKSEAAGKTNSLPGAEAIPQNSEAAASAQPKSETNSESGSGTGAGFSGSSTKLEATMEKIANHLENSTQSRPPTLGERLSEANRHVAQEQATTSVSINPHRSE